MADETTKNTIRDKLISADAFSNMIDEIQSKLDSDNKALDETYNSYLHLISDQYMVSETLTAIKAISLDYSTVVNACISANQLDLNDIIELKSLIDDKDYDGNEIIDKMDEAEENAAYYAAEAEKYYQRILDLEWWQFFKLSAAQSMYNTYTQLEWNYQAEYEDWLEIAKDFAKIINSSSSLFSNSKEFRENAKTGLTTLSSAYQEHNFNADYDRSWKNNISKIQDNIIEEIKSRWKNEDGYDWKEIDNFFNQDEDKVSLMEYIAFAQLLQEMPLNDIETLLNGDIKASNGSYISIDEGFWDSVFNRQDLSPVFKRAVEINLTMHLTQAEFTFFQENYDGDDRYTLSSELTKAQCLYSILQELEERENGSFISITQDGTNYRISITTVYTGPFTYTSSEKLFVYDYYINTDTSLTASSIQTLSTYLNVDFGNDYAIPNVRDYLVTFVLNNMVTNPKVNPFSIPGTVYTVTISGINTAITQDENTALVNMVGNDLNYIAILNALAIHANVVTTDDTKSGVKLSNAHYQNKKLALYVGAYNNCQSDNIKIEDLKDAVANNKSLATDYNNWYNNSGKNGEIDQFEKNLEDFYFNYNNGELYNQISLHNLSYEQLSEVIRAYNDRDYTINISKWE